MQAVIRSSFRDPGGYVYEEDGKIFRKITPQSDKVLRQLIGSGLYQKLLDEKVILPFTWWVDNAIQPDKVPFISYPYEWSFSMLKDAAILTLDIELLSLEHGMQLKDASAYNIQFIKGKPVFIDHLSFCPYEDRKPWVAYGQFCKHFLAPLALAAYRNAGYIKDLQVELDGLPLGYASGLLPFKATIKPGLAMHLKFHGIGGMYRGETLVKKASLSKNQLVGVLKSLRATVESLSWKPPFGWKDYEKECSYSDEATHKKAYLVEEFLRRSEAKVVVDLGCNVGLYSQVAADIGCKVIAVDKDPACIELFYNSNRNGSDILPLVMDITNPSPAIGWENEERDSFLSRLKVDTVMCLALVHHLAIGNNLPLGMIASFLSRIGKNLIVEWIPKEDKQTKVMLRYREDIFPDYTREGFEKAFMSKFGIIDVKQIGDMPRSLYLMERL